jgi:hypothetical protein
MKIAALSSPKTPYFGFLGEVGGGRSSVFSRSSQGAPEMASEIKIAGYRIKAAGPAKRHIPNQPAAHPIKMGQQAFTH